MCSRERILSKPQNMRGLLTEFRERAKQSTESKPYVKVDRVFGSYDVVGKIWYQMYSDYILAGEILPGEVQRGYCTFYRGIAKTWQIRQAQMNRPFKGIVDNDEQVELDNSLNAEQLSYVRQTLINNKNLDFGYRAIVGYLYETQYLSMTNIYATEGLSKESQQLLLEQFQNGMDLGLMQWQFLSTYA